MRMTNTFQIVQVAFAALCFVLWTASGISAMQIDLTVAKDGTGDFTRIADAIAAAPELNAKRFNIKIKEGNYTDYVIVGKTKTNITLIGDGIDRTVISGNRSSGQGIGTYETATLRIEGAGFMAREMTIENTAGAENQQAVALLSVVDSAFYLCKITGYQDTLFSKDGRQFYRNCKIYGTVDFIFGDASVIFQNCDIYARLPPPQLNTITITAQDRLSPESNTGTVIQNCNITAANDLRGSNLTSIKSYLGRPWRNYSRTIIMQSFIDNIIEPRGWLEWEKNSTDVGTIYYAEYQNRGPGASTDKRVQWSGFHVINITDASSFTVRNFISGQTWLPSLGIPFFSDLV